MYIKKIKWNVKNILKIYFLIKALSVNVLVNKKCVHWVINICYETDTGFIGCASSTLGGTSNFQSCFTLLSIHAAHKLVFFTHVISYCLKTPTTNEHFITCKRHFLDVKSTNRKRQIVRRKTQRQPMSS